MLPASAFDDLRRSGVGGIFLVLAGACLVGVLVTGLVLRGVRAMSKNTQRTVDTAQGAVGPGDRGRSASSAAVVVLILGYLGISDTPYVAEQLPYFISAGAVAVVLCAVAGMMWVSADLRDEWRELRALRQQLAAENAAPEVTAGR